MGVLKLRALPYGASSLESTTWRALQSIWIAVGTYLAAILWALPARVLIIIRFMSSRLTRKIDLRQRGICPRMAILWVPCGSEHDTGAFVNFSIFGSSNLG